MFVNKSVVDVDGFVTSQTFMKNWRVFFENFCFEIFLNRSYFKFVSFKIKKNPV